MRNLLCRSWRARLAGFFLLAGLTVNQPAQGQGSAFTYQGQLAVAGAPANGNFDQTFTVWNSASGGAQIAGPLTNSAVAISNGLFTTTLDFGPGVFTGAARWLELAVRTNGTGAFTVLTPRQACTPTPGALFAELAGSVSAANIQGALAPAQLPGNLVTNGPGGVNLFGAFSGNGAGLTNLSGGAAGIAFSANAADTNLANAGYVKIYGSFTTPDTWQAYTNPPTLNAPPARSSHTAVWTGAEMIIWGGYGGTYLNDGGRYNPAVNNWAPLPITIKTPSGRLKHAAVWTGAQMVVWGGVGPAGLFADGGTYDPALNAWNYLAANLPGTPAARQRHTAVWTGNAVLVWGGAGAAGPLSDGGSYNPGLNTWTNLPATLPNTPPARTAHSAVWTGSEMIVWGGDATGGGASLGDGGRYNPVQNAWHYLLPTATGAPAPRANHTAVWTGSQMIVWGGAAAAGDLADGGAYDPVADVWSPISAGLANTPPARDSHLAVWTGTQMIIWAGLNSTLGTLLSDGGVYTPAANTWSYLTAGAPGEPAARYQSTAIWTGAEMIVWGGTGATGPFNDGGRYNPLANTWVYVSSTPLNTPPPPRSAHTAVWTGSEMIVWGGADLNGGALSDGGRFNPALNSWVYLSGVLPNTPPGRTSHTAVWTGSQMIVWGGVNAGGFLGDGGRFDPVAGAWNYLSPALSNSPSARGNHTAVWTGTEMIVWGGAGSTGPRKDGGRFAPAANTWTVLPDFLFGTPPARQQHTAVWTGTEMIVWGGQGATAYLDDGARLNPAAGRWNYLPDTLANSPGARAQHTAVWTGSQMIVWGGVSAGTAGAWNDGAIYTPVANAWGYLPGSLINAPSARYQHTAVWDGTEMVVWGGINGTTPFGDGGRYLPSGNTWTPLAGTLSPAPAARTQHTAIWTGTQMLVWGGRANEGSFNDNFGLNPGRSLFLYQRP